MRPSIGIRRSMGAPKGPSLPVVGSFNRYQADTIECSSIFMLMKLLRGIGYTIEHCHCLMV